jgi:thiamine pyrophosphate-dependent acetolactate synthase large subunit-like protein
MVSQLSRRDAVALLVQDRADELIITGLGSASYDVHALGDRADNYYLWGAMGSAALVGLGLALAQPTRTVMVVTGDGEQLMGLGGLATIAVAGPKNLLLVVVDNGHFGETGMQLSHCGLGVRLDRVAASLGFAESSEVSDLEGVLRLSRTLRAGFKGPALHVVKVKAENLPRSLPPRDAVHVKNRFRAHLGLATA